ncbi:Non-ribosomal peptide synthetase component F [Nostoc flagelliforme CCNUN1]|uniref:Non-ribosomal peptide synthetase component F n=1 Tax=Nostoc flagelliforme CCNUN1 TaxID=2038116 RepID=A0A2K8SJ79_9NOSO|nr:non-ribosomal peptide synthetase [Nostoc flagelliforme]AUB35491.1 Non-ribosomal peptide synthetase component F [Nostoc flagelliforme CCNUN1]
MAIADQPNNSKNVEFIYPLSPMQQGMLFHTLYEPNSGMYFQQLSCSLRGHLNLSAFEQAWQRVVERHPVLRTAFLWEKRSQPLQIVCKSVNLPWTNYDWRLLSAVEQQDLLEAFLQEDRNQSFELNKAPLMRCTLIRMADNEYQFVWSYHHILIDGWSLPNLIQEVFALYDAFNRKDDLYLKTPRPYRDYIAWLQKQDTSKAEVFWRQKLKGFTAPTPLTVHKPLTNQERNSSYSKQEIYLSEQTTAALHFYARQHQLTLNNLVQGAWALLLSRYSGEADVVFGATVSGRPPTLVGVESMVGLFINTLPVRVSLADDTELLPWLKNLQAQQVECEQYSYSPLVEIHGWSEVPRGMPLFESIVVFENYPVDASLQQQIANLNISDIQSIERTNYPLTVMAVPGSQLSLNISWEYNSDLFDAATITRMMGHFQTLLAGMVAHPEQPISQIPLLTAPERQQLLFEWNDTHTEYPQHQCIHQLFEAQVERTPDAVAVVFEDQQLTYRELNARANQLAHYLRTLGVHEEVLVGLCLERSLEQLVSILAILKAGGAYLPLDPTYPQQRLSYLLADAQVKIVLTQQSLLVILPNDLEQVICWDTDAQEIVQQAVSTLNNIAAPENVAAVFYTSGSTGTPKGVVMTHQGLVNYGLAAVSSLELNHTDRVLQLASSSFDVFLEEILPTWLAGAVVVLPHEPNPLTATQLHQLISQQQVTVMELTTAHWHEWVSQLVSFATSPPSSLRLVLVGGETILPEQLHHWQQFGLPLVHVYGLTETTITSTMYQLPDRSMTASGYRLPIGRPLANTCVYLLDEQLQPVPVGVPGEVYIGGAGLSRGYLHRPQLTAERFVPNPWASFSGERLYKTGDVGRYLADGNIEFLGRRDQQVKLRGFRIELAEVEVVLSQHPSVQQTVVFVREDIPDDKRLVAYLVTHPEQTPTIAQLRQFLKEKLPEYMIPAAFVFLETLPLTPNGKVDRRSLPAPESRPELEVSFLAPCTPIEQMLADIWADVLGVEQVGIDDNFFTLGGHSLLATQLISRVRNIFQVELPLRSLFEAATIAEFSQYIQQFQQQLQQSAPPLLPVKRVGELALSFAQQRLWFFNQLEPESAAYNMPGAMRLQGQLNVAALARSLQEIVRRHEALRTNFTSLDGQAIQIIHPPGDWQLTILDWQHLSLSEQEHQTQQLATNEAKQPFDLATEPLLRVTLLVLSPQEHILMFCMHHIVSDGWSMGVFVQEIVTLYSAYCQGQPSPLPELSIQYADFAIWQRQWLQGQVLQSQLDYWQTQLAGAPALLELPTDRPRSAVQSFRGAQQSFTLSQDLTSALNYLSRKQGVTFFMTLLAGFDTLLYRYTGQADILVGSPIANRNHSEIEGLIGFFVNTLVLRTDMSGNPSFGELLTRVREMTLAAYAHQDLPFELLVEALQPERNLSHTPVFQVMFVLDNTPMSEMALPGLTLSPLAIENFTAAFDLTLSVEQTADGLLGSWHYNSDLFDAATINRMTGHLQTLLAGIVAHPEQPISQIPLLTASEQQQLLLEWNDTHTEYPQHQCIHQLFEEQVERTPDAVAVVFEDQQLTYRELNARANQLAHYLRTLGVKPEVLVAICVERSLEMVVGLLGILKAGGAYIPLDPDYPTERLSFMLSDAQVQVLLTQQRLLQNLPEHEAEVFCLDADWGRIMSGDRLNPTNLTTADNLAYIIYTSGSTGKPKGVLINHANVVRLFAATEQWFQFNNQDVWTLFHSFAFDFSVWEIWGALINGGRLVIVPYWVSRSPADFYELLCKEQVTVLNQTPSAFRQLIQTEEQITSPETLVLRWVIFGGEALEIHSLNPWFQRHGDEFPQLVNMYGITETTVHVTYRPITAADLIGNVGSVIGRPIPDLQVYVLDKNRQLLPIGVTGEMYVGGAGLARGYLNQEQLTSNVFIANPFHDDSHAKLYKTGDLARYLGNGELEYLGRIDNQVKIRGFRIELGEMEAAISQHPDVQATVVIAREDIPGDKRLVAYLVVNQQPEISVNNLRKFLDSKLPQYMIPAAFVFLETLPLTPNGKVDRRSLPTPESRPKLEVSFVAPRTPIEQMLADIWTDVLGVEQIGIDDNFFELGGDSILSLQIIARANQAGIQLTPKLLFGNQTIAQLAIVAGTIEKIQAQQGLVTGVLPLTPIQHWFFEQNLPQPHHYNQSVLLSLPPDTKPELLEQVLQQLLWHHDALRMKFVQEGESWQQINAAPNDTLVFSQIDLSTLSMAEQTTAIETAASQLQASLNLSEQPMMRVAFFFLGIDKASRLLIVIHHLVVDSVSWRILLEDLQTGYQQISRSEMIQLLPKTTSFEYWAERLKEYAQSDALLAELAYWHSQEYRQYLHIPVDYAEGTNTVASACRVSISLSEAETNALLQEVPKAYNTQINDVLLTALVLAMGQWTGTHSVLFDLEGHGREDLFEDVNLSRTIGWFTTIFPVLLQLEATNNPGDALKSVKEQLRRIPNKGIGYGLVRYLRQDREIASKLHVSPVSEISFNYLGQFDPIMNTLSGFQLASEPVGSEHSLLGQRTHLLDINIVIVGGQLQVNWTYSKNLHQATTIENLSQEFVKMLQVLIAYCLSPEAGGYTPSDFPLTNISQTQLDQVLVNLEWEEEQGKTKQKNLEDIYPLSPMQQGMLFHSLYAPDSGVYFEQLSCKLRGKLEVAKFEQAWKQVTDHHSVFRTAFIWEHHDQPLQVVYRQVRLPLEIKNWRELSFEEQQQQLEVFLEYEQQRGFQLSHPPLMRLTLIQLDTDLYQFVWSHHHLLLDGWSLPLVLKEVFEFYEAFCQGKNFRSQPAAAYRYYIDWLQQQDLGQAEVFWRQKLQGFTAPTPLKVDKPVINPEQSSYSEHEIQLTREATVALQSFAQQQQLTLNNLVQGAWALLLSRYSGEADVVFGATVSGRPPALAGVESMVGLFINTLPVRVSLIDDTELLPWLKNLQVQQVECEQYSYSPLVEIHGWSEVPRGIPLFESIIVFENYPVDASLQQHTSNLGISDVRGIEQTNYPLTVIAVPGSQLSVSISYDASRFDAAVITRMLGHFQTLLEGIVANPQQCLSQLPLLTASEQHQLLLEWNNTQADYPQNKCIHQLFEEQVDLTPDAVAVVFEDQQLTYRELNARANQLSHYLRKFGVEKDVLVGICVQRSLEMVVGLLGILKAGGAYVPLDPDYPQERLDFMLSDAQVQVLLTQQQLVHKLPSQKIPVVCLDRDWNLISLGGKENSYGCLQTENLAYVIYTSGSTGQPKGVAMSHLALVNLICWQQQTSILANVAKTLQFSPISFDVSFQEIFSTWCAGGTLVLISETLRRDPIALLSFLEAAAVERLFLPFIALQQIAEVAEGSPAVGSHLRELITAGEQLQITPAIASWLHKLPECTLHNHYGPSESHVVTAFTLINTVVSSSVALPPIGRPIANTQIYLLDQSLQPVPVGVPGELHIGGVCLARNYFHRPDMTALKFIPNPFSDQPGTRLYKTGDLGRYLPDGNIEYLGRIDNQVKIRGFRIEFGEVESALGQHPEVLENVVIIREDVPSNKLLVAYLVSHALQTPTISDLRSFLSRKLPQYMIPSVFVFLSALPLTPNGKVDRRNLPATESRPGLEVNFVAPRTPIEEMMAHIWVDVLGVQQVGIHDNFFELGGHSLLATQLISRVRGIFNVELPLRSLFENSTIAELADVVLTKFLEQAESSTLEQILHEVDE